MAVDEVFAMDMPVNEQLPYSIVLFPDPEQGGYAVAIPAFPGLFAEGDTREAAVIAARAVIARQVQELKSKGEPVPEHEATPEIRVINVSQVLNTWI